MNEAQRTDRVLLNRICDAVVEAVTEGGELGAPASVLYIGLSRFGCKQATFDMLMQMLVDEGRLTRRHDCYLANGERR